jgi:hypothetical protein
VGQEVALVDAAQKITLFAELLSVQAIAVHGKGGSQQSELMSAS